MVGVAVFDKMYNQPEDDTSLGWVLGHLSNLTGDLYGCTDPTNCTAGELTLKQWASGAVTSNQPDELQGSDYLGQAGDCIKTAWFDPAKLTKIGATLPDSLRLFPCPEILHLLPADGHVKVDETIAGKILGAADAGISLADEDVATGVVHYIVSEPKTAERAKAITDLYGLSATDPQGDFYALFDELRAVVQNYLLGGAEQSRPLADIVFGYHDESIKYLYSETTLFEGPELNLSPFVTPVFNEPSNHSRPANSNLTLEETVQLRGINTGSLSAGNVSRVRRLNDLNHINSRRPIWTGVPNAPPQDMFICPGDKITNFTNMTNGMQFAVNPGENLKAYDARFLTMMNYTQAKDEEPDWGDPKRNATIAVQRYTSETVVEATASALASNQ